MPRKKETKGKDVKEAAYSAGEVYPALRAFVGDPGDEWVDRALDDIEGNMATSWSSLDSRDIPFDVDPFKPGLEAVDRVGRIEEILDDVSAILAEREGDYGDPMVSMKRIGAFWGDIFGCGPIPASQVALAMAAFKINREICRHSVDNIRDLAGYVVLAGVLAEEEGR